MMKMAFNRNHGFTKQDRRYYLHLAVMMGLMFGFGQLPPLAPLTALGMKIAGVFLGMIYGWSMLDLILPSLTGLIALGLTGIAPMKTVFLLGFGDDLTLFILFFLVLATIVNDSGVSNLIANWFMSRKIALGRPWIFSLLIFVATYVIGMAISLIATIVMMWHIFYRICALLDLQKGEKYVDMMLAGIWFSAILGYSVFPFKPLPAMVMGAYERLSGNPVGFLNYTLIGLATSIIGLVLYCCYCRFILRPDMHKVAQASEILTANVQKTAITPYQLVTLCTLVIVVMLLFLSNILPTDWVITQFLNTVGATGIIVVAVIFLGFLRYHNQPLLDIPATFSKGAPWDVCMMVAAVIPCSGYLSAPETGIMTLIGNCFAPLLNGLGIWGFSILMVAGCFLMLQVINNVAVVALMVPLIYGFGLTMQLPVTAIMILLGICSNTALITPGASAQGAMLHSNTWWLSQKVSLHYSLVIVTITMLTLLGIGLPLGHELF